MSITFGPGITLGAGIVFGGTSASGGNGSIIYAQMSPPVQPSIQLQDGSATINDPVGFTINNGEYTGVAVGGLTANNITYFNNLGKGIFTATLGAGSTYNTIPVTVVTIPSDGGFAGLVFFFDNTASYPATFNYPITIS